MEEVLVQRQLPAGYVILNRPQRGNSITPDMGLKVPALSLSLCLSFLSPAYTSCSFACN